MALLTSQATNPKTIAVIVFIAISALLIIINTFNMDALNSSIYSDVRALKVKRLPTEFVMPDIQLCPRTDLNIKDIINIQHFKSDCNIYHLSRIPVRRSRLSSEKVKILLSSMAKRPLASSCNCPRNLKVANFPLPRSALLSFPGSGNTWLRHLIQQLTGIHTGSVYKFSSIKNGAFPYEGISDNMIVVKSHRAPSWDGVFKKVYLDGSKTTIFFDQLVILLRNPFAAFMAEFKRGSMQLGKVKNELIDANSLKWNSFVNEESRLWHRFMKNAFNTSLPLHVIFYEDLTTCLFPELVKLSYFLSNRLLNEFSFCCTLNEVEGSYHRKPSNQTINDVYSSEHRMTMNSILLEVASSVKETVPDVAKKMMGYILP